MFHPTTTGLGGPQSYTLRPLLQPFGDLRDASGHRSRCLFLRNNALVRPWRPVQSRGGLVAETPRDSPCSEYHCCGLLGLIYWAGSFDPALRSRPGRRGGRVYPDIGWATCLKTSPSQFSVQVDGHRGIEALSDDNRTPGEGNASRGTIKTR